MVVITLDNFIVYKSNLIYTIPIKYRKYMNFRPASLPYDTQLNTQPLWKKTNAKRNVQDQQSTLKSHQHTCNQIISGVSQIKLKEKYQRSEQDIDQFLCQVHHKVCDSEHLSQSQIMEKVSLDWPQDQIRDSQGKNSDKLSLFGSNQLYILNQGSRTQRSNFPQTAALKQACTLQDLQGLLSQINPTLTSELGDLMKQNKSLTQQCNSLKYNDKKTSVKIQLLTNQVDVLQKKNHQLTIDNDKLQKQLKQYKKKQFETEIHVKKQREKISQRQIQIQRSTQAKMETGCQKQRQQQQQSPQTIKQKLTSSLELNHKKNDNNFNNNEDGHNDKNNRIKRNNTIAETQSNIDQNLNKNINKHDYDKIVFQILKPAKRRQNL